jgi:hypothetical protein
LQLFDRLMVYGNSQDVEDIQAGYQAAVDNLTNDVDDLKAQLYVDTATWGLALWEDYLGIKAMSGQSEIARREVIKSKLRSAGTTTVALIKNVSEAYANGEVDVTEDNPNYRFIVTFVSTRGQPPNLDQLKDAIEEIKPAHLAVEYVFVCTTNAELAAYTHAELAAYTHAEIRALEV